MARRKAFEIKITCPVHAWGHTGFSVKMAIRFCEGIRDKKETPLQHKLLYDFCLKVLNTTMSCNGKLVSTTFFIGAVVIELKFLSKEDAQSFMQVVEQHCLSNATLKNLLEHNYICIEDY